MRARRISLATETRTDVRIAALALLRTQFREEFIDLLPKLTAIALLDLDVLRLLVMHIAALPLSFRKRNNCVHFLEVVSERILPTTAATEPGGEAKARLTLATAARCLALELKEDTQASEETDRECAVELYNILRSNRASSTTFVLF